VSGTGTEHHEFSSDDSLQERAQTLEKVPEIPETAVPETDPDDPIESSVFDSEETSSRMERLSLLSSDLSGLLLELSHEVKTSMEQLRSVAQAVELKKKELKTLYEIETSAASLKQLIQEHRLERESFERLMENQRSIWEEEKARRTQEEIEYLENLRIRRQQDEEKYEQARAAGRQEALKKVDEELRAIQRTGLEKQKAAERELQDRERRLSEKEQEWNRLIQELELLMSRLAKRSQLQSSVNSEAQKNASLTSRDVSISPESNKPEMVVLNRQNVANSSFYSESPLTGERISEKTHFPHDLSSDSFFKIAFMEEPKPLLSSLKEILQTHGRRIENAHGDFSLKRDCTTLKFLPKKISHPKSEI
jgi:hypothetical protein